MSDNFKLSRFNKKCSFGVMKRYENPNTGVDTLKFFPQWSLWYCDVDYNIQTIQQIQGARQEINKMIGIRRNPKVDSNVLCQIGKTVYKVTNIKKGDEINGTDVLTLQEYDGAGSSNNGNSTNTKPQHNYWDD